VTVMTTEQTTTLADLVRQRQDEGWSYREMERRARERGHRISHAQLAAYAEDAVRKVPSREQVEAIAAALDLGIDAVRAAVMQQYWGYVPRELKQRGKGSRVAAAVPPDLSTDEEAELVRMMEAWLVARRRGDS
jgi:transcriptional regulator with XRE-family HTH domain